MLNDNETITGNIVVVDDTATNIRVLAEVLTRYGHKVRPANSGKHALATIQKEKPDMILLDIRMPVMDGYDVCKTLKSSSDTRDIPIIFLSAANETADKVKAFRLGGVDYITKPFQIEEVLARVETHLKFRAVQTSLEEKNAELHKKNNLIRDQARRLEDMAMTDLLTGIPNRRHFFEFAKKEHARFQRNRKPFAMLLLDIDFFKRVNDQFGHLEGDEVLKNVANEIKNIIRKQDLFARWGGEEFIFLLPDTELENAKITAEKIRTMLAEKRPLHQDYRPAITVTIGISISRIDSSLEETIRLADAALYKGKKTGRNKVVVIT